MSEPAILRDIVSSTPTIMMPFVVAIHMKGEKRDSYCNYQMQGVQTKRLWAREWVERKEARVGRIAMRYMRWTQRD
jgi:hypothetical protein